MGVYFATLPALVEVSWANVQSEGSTKNRSMMMVAIVASVLSIVAHGLLTALIAGRVWTIKKRMRQLIGRGAPAIYQKYDAVIAMTIESGLISPISLIIQDVLIQTGRLLPAGIVSSCVPQVIALAPLLFLVRGGLGLATKGSHITLQAETASHDVGQVLSPPLAVSVAVVQTRSVASSEAQINSDVKPDGEYV
ncbi:hypothetical protein VNI00_015474 [Paramarasmius palmivorus]|uniref:Uncharacterized protein n=1 Tax=Paramarasmius palmivorus TaxID=297713 RepID=A0AAW0BKZ7_9AGAR